MRHNVAARPWGWMTANVQDLSVKILGGVNSNIFLLSPRTLGKDFQFDSYFFRWVETTNQRYLDTFGV